MKYIGTQGFDHEQPARSGLLITNLGTPDAPDKAALKRYLREFLWDPRVVEVPRPLWWLILNLVILNVRPARSARASTLRSTLSCTSSWLRSLASQTCFLGEDFSTW